MHLDSTNVAVTGVPYVFVFNVSYVGNETQIIQLTIDVTIIETNVENISYIQEIARNSGINQSIRFYFNDTTNNLPVYDVTTSNIVLRNYGTSTLWNSGGFWLLDSWDNGTYILEVDMGTRISGWYTLEVNVSKFPDYDISLFYVTFYFRGNYTEINLISLEDPGGNLSPNGISNYTIFEGSNLDINFNITDSEFLDNLVLGAADIYIVHFFNLANNASGTLVTNLNFLSQSHVGTIFTSNLALVPGRYLINITTSRVNYENASFVFNLTIIEKYQVRLISLYQPLDVDAGNTFILIVRSEYFNGTDWLPIVGSEIRITPYFDGVAAAALNPIITNTTGESEFEITVNINARNMNLTVHLEGKYYHQATSIYIADIEINPAFSFDDIIIYIIIGVIALAAVGGSVAIYKGVIVPKKREKQRILNEVKTIFDDAINLEHILVLYKGTGTCVFFKSYGSEIIDPELIGGFLSAVSSFGKEMVAQEALNEISYGDKMLLLADGVYIRV
ncbi:MAG: hypothetical protein MUP85_14665, partial [Candidatus Lokiarchaeota archaeon]|nr:hypothetical protein [Candidatus Lokiarchaeota archaeon]